MTSHSLVSGAAVPRVAILIDGDNIPRSFRPEIDSHARALGCVVSGQVFADIALHSDWAKEAGLDIHHCKGKQGGNAADITLVIAALDLAYRGLAQAFLIVSNDRDFEPLLRHLLKIGCSAAVLKKPPKQAVQKAGQSAAPVAAKPASPPALQPAAQPAQVKAEQSTLAQIKAFIRSRGDATGLEIARLGSVYAAIGFRVSETPERQWRAWLEARPAHFEIDPKGPESRVRLVAAGSASVPSAARSGP